MKILSAPQIRQLDAHTIQQEPIASIDLMERASLAFVDWLVECYPPEGRTIHIFCGVGNNGGDGLAIARLLYRRFYRIALYCCTISPKRSADFEHNLQRLPRRSNLQPLNITPGDPLPSIPDGDLIIDAIFGSGLNRPVEGYWAQLLDHLNQQPALRIAVDIPSGLFADQHSTGSCFQAHRTFSFELPKQAFCYPENQEAVGRWELRSIGLSPNFIADSKTAFHYLDRPMAQRLLKRRAKFGHKGSYGHALLIAGSYGKVGAAVLAAEACLRAGAGLVSLHAPACAYPILQTALPEAMVSIDANEQHFSQLPDLQPYKAIGCGCGLGTAAATADALGQLLSQATGPLVLDADALNIIAAAPELLALIPKGSILTPHPGEFRRLFGDFSDDFARNQKQRALAAQYGFVLLLKGAHTAIAAPDGQCYFNSTGNPGMATAGSGDVLTGILTALLAQGYAAIDAARLGVYLHGLAGDKAAARLGQESLIARDLIAHLGAAWQALYGE
ncbi:MAG: NAD(P)H-hydrate dehydratase [Bacteroidota bacterium]